MTKLSSSPGRHTFQKNSYIKRCEEKGEQPNEDYLRMYDSFRDTDLELEQNPEHAENNLEYDLRSCNWLVAKARASDTYAQHIYAALCNQRWQKRDVLPILKDEWWSCSWRSAGGIVADLLGHGDYIDWYCSGIGDGLGNGDSDGVKGYVAESVITEEIENDFYQLGWIHSEWPDDDKL